MTRPIGIAPGTLALAAAWAASVIIALLTGASAVVILLVSAVVGFTLAAVGGWFVLRGASIAAVTTSDLASVGDELRWRLLARTSARIWVELRVDGDVVASGAVTDGENTLVGRAPRRGVHHEVEVWACSAASAGLVWWRRGGWLPIGPLGVGAAVGDVGAVFESSTDSAAAGARPVHRFGRDLPDGVRPWRDGDEASAVHWLSSLRSSELVVRQQLRDVDELWVVHAHSGTGDPDGEASRVRSSLDAGMSAGASVAVRVDDGEPRLLVTRRDVTQWSAEFESAPVVTAPRSWWRRAIRLVAAEPERELTTRARWAVAAAGAPPLVMLLQPLGYRGLPIAITLAATAVAAVLTVRFGSGRSGTVRSGTVRSGSGQSGSRARGLRQLAGIVTASSVAASLIDPTRITSIASSLLFLMPQLLIALVVLQGFDCVDRRSARVSLACSVTLTAYAAGVRVDDALGLWLLFACGLFVWALGTVSRSAGGSQERQSVDGSARSRRPARRVALSVARGARIIGATTVVVAILAVLPVPRGPAQLTLPSWLQDRRPVGSDGGLADPEGSPLLGGAGGRRGGTAAGSSAGSYAGFSPTMDTSLRGDLGDEVVLRVKAPSADYWRGQTYSYFDGRTWSVDDRSGARTDGPDHAIRPAEGDVSWSGDEFVQTFYVEVDLPNLVFAATSARRVLLDAPLWQRPDGALRAGLVLPAGSAYTVVSERSTPTAAGLRLAGDVSAREVPREYLQLPPSTTARVRDLARQLTAGSQSTFDTVLAMNAWLGEHVTYDLDAPVPPAGADAVDDFLFETQLGFCEQIATATAVMLRSLGVPARVATGFVPSSRDAIAGVWISRAKDAHAWVEVHFPGYGWVAFDPTASVPLSGDADAATIGGELLSALSGWIAARITIVLGAALAVALCIGSIHIARRWQERRRRGRWGLLQDRFVAAAIRRGAQPTGSNAQLAESFATPRADAVARVLDSSAFAASWVEDDDEFARVAADVRLLEASVREGRG